MSPVFDPGELYRGSGTNGQPMSALIVGFFYSG